VNAYLTHGDSYFYVKRQVIFLGVGVLGAFTIMKLPPSTLRLLSWFGLGIATVLLILTYTPLGISVNGNRNWLYLGSSLFSIQPAEFAKLAMILWGADVLARKYRLLDQPKHLLVPFLPVSGILVLLVLFQGDAGTAVVMAFIATGILWIVGAPVRVLLALASAGVAGVVGIFVTSSVRMRRLAAFLDPTLDADGANHQANAGMFAIASGGWWGVGLGASRQKWGSLPEAHTDFIFAVLGEEFGLFGSLVVLAMIGILGYAGIRIAMRADDLFVRYAAAGITTWFMVQALINLAVVLRLLPIAGVPLPVALLRRVGLGRQPVGGRRAPGVRPQRTGGSPTAGEKGDASWAPNDHGRGLADQSRPYRLMNGSASGSVVLAGGGSAGHTSPLIATGLELRRLSPELAVTALGTARGLETTCRPSSRSGIGADPTSADAAPSRQGSRACGTAVGSGCDRNRTTTAAGTG
jgi:cell division protein FtsW